MVDAVEGVLGIEWIDGASVRVLLGGGAEGEVEAEETSSAESESELSIDTETTPLENEEEDRLKEYGISQGTRASCHGIWSTAHYSCGR